MQRIEGFSACAVLSSHNEDESRQKIVRRMKAAGD